ncbi:MAG TPA: hypothetical protein VFY18_04065 [Candidatus Limnocylindrales bacterium]|nr:hypothetical protein [Candidatus Limnocylindrales bacterium]
MHKQFRLVPSSSPPDVEKLLRRLKEADINLAGAGGSNVEYGGEFAFAVDHGQEDRAEEVLKENDYRYRIFDKDQHPELTVCFLENRAGTLHACVEGVSAANLEAGRIIRDIVIGIDRDEGIGAQIFSEAVRTPQALDHGDEG